RVTRACGLVGISRSLYRYRSRRAPCEALRERIIELAAEKRRYGYRRIHVLLRREGWEINWKKTYRLYREAGLAVRRRKRKRVGPFERRPLPKPTTTNESWSMDFVSDWLADGRRLRTGDHAKRTGDIGGVVVAILHDVFKERRDRFLGFEIVIGIVGCKIGVAHGVCTEMFASCTVPIDVLTLRSESC